MEAELGATALNQKILENKIKQVIHKLITESFDVSFNDKLK